MPLIFRYSEGFYEINAANHFNLSKLSLIFQETTSIEKRFVIIPASVKQ